MSGFIHIAEKAPAWHAALRLLGVVAALVGLSVYALSDEGLPIASPGTTQAPRVAAVQPAPWPDTPLADTAATPEATDADTDRDAQDAPTAPSTAAAAPDDTIAPDDFAARNAAVEVSRLTATRPIAARAFLSEVLLAPGSQAGFVVAEVLPESRFERMGLRPGDVIYSLDTPRMASVDESSMIAMIQQTELELDVYRKGTLTRLHTSLASDEEGDHAGTR
ncbi:MAG: hypothetical protein KF891_24295 [Rhizobacter sp.]|nr:hypothetical protein [Rhizobacter sp.]